ncbi:MAG: type I 3-dehydroquinate dehydratase [Thermoplasmatota archaeon]
MTEIVATAFVNNTKEFLNLVENYNTELFELRVDSLKSYDVNDLKHISDKLIITVRDGCEGGVKDIPEKERIDIFDEFLSIGPSYIDIEFKSVIADKILNKIQGSNTKSILSYHNFEETPDFEQLERIYRNMNKKSPDIVKIVTFCNSSMDNLNMFRLNNNKTNLTAFCMGRKGIISRLFSLIYSPITYGSISEKKTAPGQLSVEELKIIRQVLEDG